MDESYLLSGPASGVLWRVPGADPEGASPLVHPWEAPLPGSPPPRQGQEPRHRSAASTRLPGPRAHRGAYCTPQAAASAPAPPSPGLQPLLGTASSSKCFCSPREDKDANTRSVQACTRHTRALWERLKSPPTLLMSCVRVKV